MIIPAMMESVRMCAPKNSPRKVAVEPRETNTVLKPSTNITDKAMIYNRSDNDGSLAPVNWSKLVPAMKHKYGGTNGNTHGDKKDSKPARSAPMIVTSNIFLSYLII